MGSSRKRILFIDGFAGPGEYEGGEEGSPVIALRALIEHRFQKHIGAEVVFIFIEKNEKRADHLRRLVKELRPELPDNCRIDVINGVFDGTMESVLSELDEQAKRLAPSLVMIDPFGVSDTPMSVIERILTNPSCEAYISLMYESINRFISTPEFAPHLDALFGCTDWPKALEIEDPEDRRQFLYDLYEAQLRQAGAEYVVHFDLCEGNRLVYSIFFGTQNLTGCDRMKEAIWSVAPGGDFTFRGTKSDQLTLSLEEPNFEPLREALLHEFSGESWVTIKQVENFVACDRTDYYTRQLRRGALIPMEDAGEAEVAEKSRTKKRTYPKGTRIRFK